MKLAELHRQLCQHQERVAAWFATQKRGLALPFYASFDLRDAGYKLGPVDANIFPAGFNNICQTDRENSFEIARRFLDEHYGDGVRRVLLLTEEHTNNPYYWDNVAALKSIVENAGREVRLGIPREMDQPLELTSASGQTLTVHTARRDGEGIDVAGFKPDLVLSNNDFSVEYEDWARGLTTPVNPPRELGWYRRRKDRFFKVYNQLTEEFCALLDMDPWTLQVETEVFPDFDVDDEVSRERLAIAAQAMYDRLAQKYQAHGVDRKPFLFIKNNAGTYGLGVLSVSHPDEIRGWNNKTRKKMKAAKGGREVTEVIIQEGIPTTTHGEGGVTAEPAIYMIGCTPAGGFLRSHGEKNAEESLNSPGAVFQRLCLADLAVKPDHLPMEMAYGWIAKLAMLSVAREARELEVEFRGYRV